MWPWGSINTQCTHTAGFRRTMIHKPFRSRTRKPHQTATNSFVSLKYLAHLLSLRVHKAPPPQAWRLGNHAWHHQSQSSATPGTTNPEPASPNIIYYGLGQPLLDCQSAVVTNSERAPFITQLASVHWQSRQPTRPQQSRHLLMKMRGFSGSATPVSPLNMFRSCSILWLCLLPHVAEINWGLRSSLHISEITGWFHRGWRLRPCWKLSAIWTKWGHLQERNAFVFNFIPLVEVNNLTFRF